MQIRRIQALDDRFPVTDAMLREGVGDDADSLAAAGAEGRLYLSDYAMVESLPCGVTRDGEQKYLSAPLALFAVPRQRPGADRSLQPIAVQCGQRPGPECPIFTPDSG
jgi:arachidonate 15-lipoxygenase